MLRRIALIAALCSLAFAVVTHAAAADPAPFALAAAPTASFITSPAHPDVGHPVTFDASASTDPAGEAIVSYTWSFGDGVTQTTSSPITTHVYAAVRAFTVTLTVLDAGGSSSAPVAHAVGVAADKPAARFSAKPSTTTAGKTVNFDASASSDSDGDAIVSYQWSFGDGSTATTAGPLASHQYAATGTFAATLTVVDSHGNASAAASHPVKVNPPKPVPIPPTAHFGFSPAHPVTGQLVTFDASASSDTDGDTIKSYRWSFGDHSSKTTTAAVIQHAYVHPGTFTVGLVVFDSHGSHSTITRRKLTVVVPPPPSITMLKVRTCVHRSKRCHRRGLYVRFTLSVPDRVVLTVTRRHHRRTLKRVVTVGRAGRNTVRVRFARLGPGHYVLGARASGGGAQVARFTWRGH